MIAVCITDVGFTVGLQVQTDNKQIVLQCWLLHVGPAGAAR